MIDAQDGRWDRASAQQDERREGIYPKTAQNWHNNYNHSIESLINNLADLVGFVCLADMNSAN